MDLKLKDKVVLVTGGTGGIGAAIVKAFLGEGAKVAFSSTSQKKIDDLIPTLNAAEGQVAGFVADLNKEEDIKNLVENAKAHFGTLDVIIPNAGYEGKAHPVQDMTLELFEQTYMLNVFAVMLTLKYAAPTLIEKKSGPFDPKQFHDHYVEALYRLIDRKRKAKGKKIIEDEDDAPARSGSNVADLMAALKQSMEGGEIRSRSRKAPPKTTRKTPAKKTTTRKAPARKHG